MIKVLLRLSVCLILIEAIVAMKYGKWTLQRKGCPRRTRDYLPACFEDGRTHDRCDNLKMKCEGRCPCPTSCEGLCKRKQGRWGRGPVCGENGQTYDNSCDAKCEKVKIKCNGKCPCPTSCEELCIRRKQHWYGRPYCGENGKTYNACSAECEKVKIKCGGKCPCPPYVGWPRRNHTLER